MPMRANEDSRSSLIFERKYVFNHRRQLNNRSHSYNIITIVADTLNIGSKYWGKKLLTFV